MEWDFARLLKIALWVTAPVNILGGAVAAASPSTILEVAFGVLAPDPVLLGVTRIFYAFVVVLGVGFIVAARDPARQSALVLVGGLAKLAAVCGWIALYLQGNGTPNVLAACAFDAPLGLLFVFAFVRLHSSRA